MQWYNSFRQKPYKWVSVAHKNKLSSVQADHKLEKEKHKFSSSSPERGAIKQYQNKVRACPHASEIIKACSKEVDTPRLAGGALRGHGGRTRRRTGSVRGRSHCTTACRMERLDRHLSVVFGTPRALVDVTVCIFLGMCLVGVKGCVEDGNVAVDRLG
ncbi:hypothetical protein EVAR_60382_1 [Eumeta japonica]|uniref:Uncharacterized protein n=1 Tax=Eumeta variegata TaxID=151549 RepID=A0A4C1ZPM1_EUMVA|nr:hypothetical protein EVAR_60382_1 [Eumeta japonica]